MFYNFVQLTLSAQIPPPTNNVTKDDKIKIISGKNIQ